MFHRRRNAFRGSIVVSAVFVALCSAVVAPDATADTPCVAAFAAGTYQSKIPGSDCSTICGIPVSACYAISCKCATGKSSTATACLDLMYIGTPPACISSDCTVKPAVASSDSPDTELSLTSRAHDELTALLNEKPSLAVAPFTAKQQTYVVGAEGEESTQDEMVARRNDSAEYYRSTWLKAERASMTTPIRQLTFPDGRQVFAVDELHAISTMQMSPDELLERDESFNSPVQGCSSSSETVIDHSQVFGLNAVKVSYVPANAPMERDISVRLVDFACFETDFTRQIRQDVNSPYKTVMGRHTLTFTPGDPSATLFSGFENYNEMMPSEIKHAFAKAKGLTPQQCPKCYTGDPVQDKAYLARHK